MIFDMTLDVLCLSLRLDSEVQVVNLNNSDGANESRRSPVVAGGRGQRADGEIGLAGPSHWQELHDVN